MTHNVCYNKLHLARLLARQFVTSYGLLLAQVGLSSPG